MKPLAAHVAQAGHLALPLIPLFSPPSPHIQSVCTSCRLQISLQIWAHLPPLPSQSHLLPLLSCHHHLRLGLKKRISLLHLASSQRKPIGTCLSEGRCATTRDSKRCFQANTSLSLSVGVLCCPGLGLRRQTQLHLETISPGSLHRQGLTQMLEENTKKQD